MKYSENTTTAADYLKKAIPHMVKNQIPANPINYALWYNYVANHIPLLNREMDNIIDKGLPFDAEQSEDLYYHFVIGDQLEQHHETLESITQVASKILSQLGVSLQGSDSFDQQLGDNLQQLEQASSLTEVTDIIDQVMSTTEGIRSANAHFKEDLQAANNEINNLQQQLEAAEKHAYIDQLTQLYNRHAFDRQLAQLLENDAVAGNVCLVLADLDHFKSFNDDYGHVIGDRVLQRMGELIKDFCPDHAIGTRYGGEEFAIIINNDSVKNSVEIAERLREKLLQLRVKLKNSDKVLDNISASFGVAKFTLGETMESFIDRADKALYHAKKSGRNRVEIFHEGLLQA